MALLAEAPSELRAEPQPRGPFGILVKSARLRLRGLNCINCTKL